MTLHTPTSTSNSPRQRIFTVSLLVNEHALGPLFADLAARGIKNPTFHLSGSEEAKTIGALADAKSNGKIETLPLPQSHIVIPSSAAVKRGRPRKMIHLTPEASAPASSSTVTFPTKLKRKAHKAPRHWDTPTRTFIADTMVARGNPGFRYCEISDFVRRAGRHPEVGSALTDALRRGQVVKGQGDLYYAAPGPAKTIHLPDQSKTV